MSRPHSPLGLALAIALYTGSSTLIEHPSSLDRAPGAYSDITIAEADNQKLPNPDANRSEAPGPPQATTPVTPSTADGPSAVETTPGEESKGKPTVKE